MRAGAPPPPSRAAARSHTSPNGRGPAGAENDALCAAPARHARLLFPPIGPHLGELDWQYRWTGFMAMTPDRYPRLFELAPGIAAALGYSGRGICTATILGAELARWAAGEAGIDELAVPAPTFPTPPHPALPGMGGQSGRRSFSVRDRAQAST